jgi:hypothetical protein
MEKRYRLICFVGPGNDTLWADEDGTRTYGSIFSRRPDWARFAVLHDGQEYLCADLWETEMDVDTLEIYVPKSRRFPTRDAAVMTAHLKS